MFTPYTPTTDDLRTQYAQRFPDVEGAKQDFDRWLAAHDSQVAANAWDIGFHAGVNHELGDWEIAPDPIANPYRIAGGTSHE